MPYFAFLRKWQPSERKLEKLIILCFQTQIGARHVNCVFAKNFRTYIQWVNNAWFLNTDITNIFPEIVSYFLILRVIEFLKIWNKFCAIMRGPGVKIKDSIITSRLTGLLMSIMDMKEVKWRSIQDACVHILISH